MSLGPWSTWTELAAAGPEGVADRVLVVPLGSTEQHGPHLPLDTDARIATELAGRLCAARQDTVLAPTFPFGASGEHAGFPGTLSIGTEVLAQVLVELCRSADAYAGVVLVNGHGGNGDALRLALDRLGGEGRCVLGWSWSLPAGFARGDAHAGFVETSLLLACAPDAVRLDRLEAGATRPLAELWDELRVGGVGSVSPNGVLGDPNGANPEDGRALLDRFAADLLGAVAARFPTGR